MNIDATPGDFVLLAISDTGTGMTREVAARIFDPFFTTKDIGKGTGLGLSTTLTIVKSHGGFLDVYTETDRGTQFSVYLPSANRYEIGDVVKAKNAPLADRNELILIVDDEENIRSVTKATLEVLGYRTILASDGTDAVAVYAQHGGEIAAVLTDLAMPYMDGEALIRALKKINPDVKVIAMSGLMSAGQTAELRNLNVGAFLSKPITADTLITALQKVLH